MSCPTSASEMIVFIENAPNMNKSFQLSFFKNKRNLTIYKNTAGLTLVMRKYGLIAHNP